MSTRNKTLPEVLERLLKSRRTHPQGSSIGNSAVGKLFIEKLAKRLEIVDDLNDLTPISFVPSIKPYIETNEIIPHAQKLYDNRFWIYINNFCRVYDGLFMYTNYYDLEYIKDSETNEINPLSEEVLYIIGAIVNHRLNISPLNPAVVQSIAFHGMPLAETFTVPKDLIICYISPITNISIASNDEISKIYEYIANNYTNYWAMPDIINSDKHITKYLQFYYPNQQIWDVEIGKPSEFDLENEFGYFTYNPDSKKMEKTIDNNIFFKDLDGTKLSDYCKNKTGILFVNTCRACNLNSSLNSADVELMCIYETLLKIINNIISEIIFNLYTKIGDKDKYIDIELNKVQLPAKNVVLRKKQQHVEFDSSKIVYDMITMSLNHIPFFDPFLSVDYDISTTKRKLFGSKFPLLPKDDPTKKSSNLALIERRIANIPDDKLFKSIHITRDHILSILLDAISFSNNDNIVKYLCDLLLMRDNLHLIDTIIHKSENITYYIFLNSEYRKYAIYLLVNYYRNKNFRDILDYDLHNYLKSLNKILLDKNDIMYTLDIKNAVGDWDMFFRVLMYNLTQYISGKSIPETEKETEKETDKSYNIYFQNVINITELIADILSREIKQKNIKNFGLIKFSDFHKWSQDKLVENYTKQNADLHAQRTPINSKGGKKIIHKTIKNKYKHKKIKSLKKSIHI